MLRLSDVQAQPWLWRAGGVSTWMRPLSLSTFATAELYGCGLDDLMSGDESQQLTAWVTLYAFLQEREPDQALQDEIAANPDAFTAFVQHVQKSLTGDDDEDEHPKAGSHRRNKDPRKKIGTPGGPTIKKTNEPQSPESSTDYGVLFDLARYARLSLDDLYRMTFKGLIALTKHLKDNPPVANPMTGQID